MPDRTCSIDGCNDPVKTRGWCVHHYNAWHKHGDPLHPVRRRPTFGMTREEAFLYYMPEPPPPAPSPTEGCWPWRGPREPKGYGAYKADRGVIYKAHRVSYELYVGPIPDGLLLRHTCDNPPCIQPFVHLLPGTDADNNRDMMERGRNRPTRGVDQSDAKLTDDVVRAIRAEYAAGGVSQQAIADRIGVSQVLVSKVVRRKLWTHVP